MRTKDVKNMLDILTTEVKIHEINKEFLESVPKESIRKDKLRLGRIILPIVLCLCFSAAFITLLIISINRPLFGEELNGTVTDTKKEITYQLIETLALIDDENNLNYLSDSISEEVQKEVEKYYTLANYYFDQEEISVDSLVSDDANYQNKYRIKLKQEVYFYFNETTTAAITDIDKVSSNINGYVLLGENKFIVECFKDVSNNIQTIKLKVYYQENKSLESTHVIEEDLIRFDFTCYTNGEKQKEITLNLEKHLSYNEALIIAYDHKYEYIFQNDKTIVDVKIPDIFNGKIIITKQNNEFVYQVIE